MTPKLSLWLCALSIFAACSSGSDQKVSADGPWNLEKEEGGIGIDPPAKAGSWSGMFGSMFLCVDSPGAVTITKVEPVVASDGQPVRAVIRRVSRAAVLAGSTPIGSLTGEPETELASEAGETIEPAVGAKGSRPCSDDPYADGFDELLVVLSTKGEGDYIGEVRVHYERDGRKYQTANRWKFALCESDDVCRGLDLDEASS